MKSPKIVVIGGGTGSFTLLSQLKFYTPNITALVNMADNGGSTGILRDELGVLPPGDIRQCLVALAREPRTRDLFNYRFDEGTFAGHSFGNLFLTAVQKMTNDFAGAVKLAGEVLDIVGQVVPVTLDNVDLVCTDGKNEYRGQHQIDLQKFAHKPNLWLDPAANINPQAQNAIASADLVVIAPGNLYGSLAPALLVQGMSDVLAQTPAKIAYVCNLVTKPGQTDDFTVSGFVSEIERFLHNKVKLDYVLYNNATPNKQLLDKYAKEGEFWVKYDQKEFISAPYKAIGDHFVQDTPWEPTVKKDLLARTLIRHNAQTVAKVLMGLV